MKSDASVPLSLGGYLLLVAALTGLLLLRTLFAVNWIGGIGQVLAAALMVWARLTFGRRSFHAAANPTAGGLVTSGPYRFLRHPIYAAVFWFLWIGVLSHRSLPSLLLGLLATLAIALRMHAEERLLLRQYPDYAAYAARTKRLLPGVF